MAESLEGFCGSKFWDYNQVWNTTNPDLPICFQKTILVWVPCGFLWIFSPLETHYLLKSTSRHIPWTGLNICKLVICILLILVTFAEMCYSVHQSSLEIEVPSVNYYSPFVRFVTFILVSIFTYLERKRGIQSSGIQFIFWLLLSLAGFVTYRTKLLEITSEDSLSEGEFLFVIYMIYYPLVVTELILNCIADAPPRFKEIEFGENPCPELGASFISKLMFSWFDGMAITGYRRPLERKDLWSMNPKDTSAQIIPIFDKHWNKELQKSTASSNQMKATYTQHTEDVTFRGLKTTRQPSILKALSKSFGATFLFGAFLKLINDLLIFVNPMILELLIKFISGKEPAWRGYLYAVVILLSAFLQSLILGQYFHKMFLIGMRVRSAVISAVYRKALRMSNASKRTSTVGEIVNLMSVDAQRFMDLTTYLNLVWSAPLQIALALYFLWKQLGPSVLTGLGIMILLIPANGFIANKSKQLQVKQMKNKDERVKLMNEILSGIKVLKLYAWEYSFFDQINSIRSKELKVLKTAAYLNAGSSFLWMCAPFMVMLATFAMYVLVDEANILDATKIFVSLSLFNILRLPMALLPMLIVAVVQVTLATFTAFVLSDPSHVLDAQKAFVSVALFNILRFPMNMLPLLIMGMVQVAIATFTTFVMIDETNILDPQKAFVSLSLFQILRFPLSMLPNLIMQMVQAGVSLKRMNNFMNNEELNPNNVSHDKFDAYPLSIQDSTFSWGPEEEPTLTNINLQVYDGQLVAVVGSVGSGKSSLISALLGEMEKLSGHVNTKGSIAYVSQQAWIQNATLKNNILFGRPYDEDKYQQVLEACALKSDIEMLPGADETEIGEKGINLSGGQKQRVSLARAVYSNADIYFLDDPLSAVDSHVGKHIFENVLGPNGLLKRKTRLLITHGITYLPQVDKIIVLKGGMISEEGSYKELLEKKGAFAEFVLTYLSEGDNSDNAEELQEIKEELLAKMGPELERQLSRQLSRALSNSSHISDGSVPSGRVNSISRETSIEKAGKGREGNGFLKTANNNIEKEGTKLVKKETTETGQVNIAVYLHYLRSIGLLISVLTFLFNVLAQGCSVGSNVWLSIWSNDATDPNKTQDTDLRDLRLGVYGGLGFGQAILVLTGSLTMALGTVRASQILHSEMVINILHSPMSFFDTTPLGRIVNRFSKDVDVVDNTLPMTIRSWLSCFFQVVATLVVISISTPIFLSVIAPVGLLYYFIQRFYVATSRQLKRLESVSRSPIYSHFSETITGATTIRAYGLQRDFIVESEARVDENQVCYYPSIVSNRWLAIRLEFVGNLIVFSAALFAVLGRDSMNPGLVGLSLSYALSVTSTLNWMVRMSSELETNIVAVERIKEYTETKQEAQWEIESTKPDSLWPQEGKVVFKNYSTRYREGLDLIVQGVTCSFASGEKIGIVGRTGAGKSSLTLGLFRIIEPAEGTIIIDGVDISQIGLHDLRSKLTIIPQDPVLFSGILRQNLDPFNKYSDAEVWKALEQSHLKQFVTSLPMGLQHEVAEGGENLSVGQRQLVCLARALLRKTKILILDEATAAVDLETDDLIQTTIRKEFAECTVITIAHRLNTIMDSTRVLVLDRGVIKEFDTPSNLLQNRNSIFYGMAKDANLV